MKFRGTSTKRKGVRQNGLLQFILWREAFRAEKDRKDEDVREGGIFLHTAVKTRAENRRRLSFQ